MRRLVMAAAILATSGPLAAAESCATLDAKAVAALFDDWNFALSSLEASQVVQRYWPNAVLLPTVSNTPRTNAAMIGDYFEHFIAKRPRGRIDTRTIQGGCNLAIDMGTYTFSLMDDKGVTSEVAARYTFVYQYRDGAWKILHHHSSAMPESGANTTPADAHAAAAPSPAAAKPVHEVPVAAPKVAPERPKAKGKDAAKQAAHPAPAAAKSTAVPKVDASSEMFANLASSPPPSKFYPPEAARHKEHGTVNLKVCADDAGALAGTPEIVTSSGSKLLDEAARSWASAAKWVPATLNHERVEGCALVDVVFEATA
jgi:uncharacterized protein (TIGR02246 family)